MEVFKSGDTAPISGEDDGEPHTINFCMTCHNLRKEETMEPTAGGIRTQDVEVLRSQEDVWEELPERSGHGTETW